MQTLVELKGTRVIELRLQHFEEALHAKMLQVVRRLTDELWSAVEAAEPERTGRLRQQTRQRVLNRENRISGSVRPASRAADARKAAALEYGSKRDVAVSAYTRAQGDVVEAYHRRSNIEPHRFLRGPFGQRRASIDEELNAAFAQIVAEADKG
jgi:hypothetical protein